MLYVLRTEDRDMHRCASFGGWITGLGNWLAEAADRAGGEEAKTSNNIKCPVRSSESVTYDSALGY